MTALCIICILAAIGSIAYAIYAFQHCTKINKENIRENEKLALEYSQLTAQTNALIECNQSYSQKQEELLEKNKELNHVLLELNDRRDKLNFEIQIQQQEVLNKQKQQSDLTAQITALRSTIDELSRNEREAARAAFEQYCDSLDTEYILKNKEHDASIQLLENAYDEKQQKLMYLNDCLIKENREDIDALKELFYNKQKVMQQEFDTLVMSAKDDLAIITAELNKMRATRAAAMEAQLREREIKEQRAFYSLPISEIDLADIKALEGIKSRLSKPRVLSMLIWQTYFQKPMTQLCNNVLGTATICGIYKITNQLTDQCYIGQSVDVATRWKDHAKCGLNIDTPIGNKLYAAMIQDGLWNFTFELLEKCERQDLDEKERKYIELYQANEFGYNSTKGNK